MKKFQIAVIGSAGQEEYPLGSLEFKKLYDMGYEVGKFLAHNNCFILTGGKSGIMEAASKWSHEGWGVNIGFIKWSSRNVANPYVDIEIVTNMGHGGDAFLIPYSADGAIVIGWGAWTLKEIAGFYLQGKPIVLMENSWWWAKKLGEEPFDERKIVPFFIENTPESAVKKLLSLL